MKILITENQYIKILNESLRIERNVVRKVVKDLTKIIKNNKEGDFYLPIDAFENHQDDESSEDNEKSEFYDFEDYPVEFSVELTIKHDENLNRFLLNGAFSLTDNVIEIVLKVNPDNLRKQLYDIIGELNIIIAHELEHGLQNFYYEFDMNKKEPKTAKKYYLQPHEVPAQIQGFKRLAKLKRVPFEDVVRDWFKNNRTIHNMKTKDEEFVIQNILNSYKEKYD
jgi:hypothetical protein